MENLKITEKLSDGTQTELCISDVISSSHKVNIDEKTGEIKLPKRKLKIPTDYYL